MHATYVLARINCALVRVRTTLDDSEHALIDSTIARNKASREVGLEVVTAHACFTADGRTIFEACREAAAASSGTSG